MTACASSSSRGDAALMITGLAGSALNLAGALGMSAMATLALLEADPDSASLGAWAAGSLLAMAIAGVPAIGIGLTGLIRHRQGHPLPPATPWIVAAFGLLFPFALLAGTALLTQGNLTFLAIPVHLATAALPVVFVVLLAQTLGPRLTLRRLWSQFLIGLWGMPLVAIVLEIFALVPVAIVAVAGLSASMDLAALLEPMLEAVPESGMLDEQAALRLLFNPWVVVSLFAFVAGVVPLLEEAVKTLAVLPLARRLSPAEAFAGGTLGGAGYALFEALFLTQPDASWLTTMMGRGGATAMHAFTAALTCWGISQVVHRRRWARLALAYLSSVTMHALWNASVIATSLAQVNQEAGTIHPPALVEGLALNATPVLLITLSLTALVGLGLGARRLTRHAPSTSQVVPVSSQLITSPEADHSVN